MEPLIGMTLNGRFRVDTYLGGGSMADVYRGLDLEQEVPAAIKVLRPAMTQSFELVERFRREADALARLDHPRIVSHLGAGQDGDYVYIAMRFIEGHALSEEITGAGEPMPVDRVTAIADDICSALSYAHKQGIVHRDIKPGNILLDRGSGQAVLTDFGIARASDAATMTSFAIGTPAYMSPEQCRGTAVDGRSDIYSFGCVLYEMLASVKPFRGAHTRYESGSTHAIVHEQMTRAAEPLRLYNPELKPEVQHVIARAMSKSPAQRQADAADLASDLRRAVNASGMRTLRVVAPPLADVRVDGTFVGRGTVVAQVLADGPHVVEARAPGSAPFSVTVAVPQIETVFTNLPHTADAPAAPPAPAVATSPREPSATGVPLPEEAPEVEQRARAEDVIRPRAEYMPRAERRSTEPSRENFSAPPATSPTVAAAPPPPTPVTDPAAPGGSGGGDETLITVAPGGRRRRRRWRWLAAAAVVAMLAAGAAAGGVLYLRSGRSGPTSAAVLPTATSAAATASPSATGTPTPASTAVRTPEGTAAVTGNTLVPATDLAYTSGSLSGPKDRQIWSFDATQGDFVVIRAERDPSGTAYPRLQLIDPAGHGAGSASPSGDYAILSASLGRSGTYQVVVMSAGGAGDYKIRLQKNPFEPIVSGTPISEAITEPDEEHYFTFTGTAGQFVVLRADRDPSGDVRPHIQLINPFGQRVGEASDSGHGHAILEHRLKDTGTFTAEFFSDAHGSGPFAIRLSVDPFIPIAVGQSLPGRIDLGGERIFYHFDASAGQTVVINLQRGADLGGPPELHLINPFGQEIAQASADSSGLAMLTRALVDTGTFTIIVEVNDDQSTGGFTLSLALK